MCSYPLPDPNATPGRAPRRAAAAIVVTLVVVVAVAAAALWFFVFRDEGRRGLQEPDGGIGATILDETVQFTVTGVEDGPATLRSDEFGGRSLEPNGRFVTVHFTAGNLGTGNASIHGDEQLLYDQHGRAFQPVAYLPYGGVQLFLSSVRPGNERRESFVYDLPDGSDPHAIELAEKDFYGGEGVLIALR